LVAAGGLVNGAQVAALLTLGASGALLGTRFLLTPESIYAPEYKDALLSATRTVRTFVFDEVASLVWPDGIDGRALPNQTLVDDAKGLPLEERKKTYMEAKKKHDVMYAAVWAGSSVALVNELVAARVCMGSFVRDNHYRLDICRVLHKLFIATSLSICAKHLLFSAEIFSK
jgi:nitronate monooxygenase